MVFGSRMAACGRASGYALFFAVGTAFGAELDASVSLGVLRTDNLTLAAVDPEAATVWQLTPTFGVTQESTRLSTRAAYRMDAYYYDQRGESEIYNTFDGALTAAIVPDRFFIGLGGARSQAILDPQSTIPIGNLPISGNRVDMNEAYVGPSFEIGAGGSAVVSGSARRTFVRYGDPVLANGGDDYDYDSAVLGVDNYRKGSGVTWAARYNYERSDYGEEFLPYEFRRALLELGFWADEATRVFLAGGKESPWDRPLEPQIDDSFWELGFSRQIGERLSAQFAAGERSFGKTKRGSVDYRFARGSFAVGYDETPSTTSQNRFSRGGLLDPNEPLDYLFRAGGLERFIANRFQAEIALTFARLGITLNVFDETREDRTLLDGTPLAEESQSGGSFGVTWQLRPRTEIRAGTSSVDREFANGVRSDLSTAVIGATYRLGARTQLAVSIARSREESPSTSGLNYRSEVISAAVTRSF